jgi:VWFA-related protein
LIDEMNTAFPDSAFVCYSINKFIAQTGGRLDQRTQVLTLTEAGLKVLQDSTLDGKAIMATLKKHTPALPYRSERGIEGIFERMRLSLRALADIATANLGYGIRTNLVWIGSGFPLLDELGLTADEREPILAAIRHVSSRLLQSRVVVYTVDPETVGSWGEIDPAERLPVQHGLQPSRVTLTSNFGDLALQKFAEQTGGRDIYGRNDIDRQVAAAIAEGNTAYALSYYPSDTNFDGKFRKITVEIGLPQLQVHARDGYYALSDVGTPSTESAQRDMQFALASRLPHTAISVSAKRSDLHLNISADPSVFAWKPSAGGGQECDVLIGFIGAGSRGVEDTHFKLFRARKNQVRAQPAGPQRLEFSVDLPLEMQAGSRFRVAVRDADSGRIGTAEAID